MCLSFCWFLQQCTTKSRFCFRYCESFFCFFILSKNLEYASHKELFKQVGLAPAACGNFLFLMLMKFSRSCGKKELLPTLSLPNSSICYRQIVKFRQIMKFAGELRDFFFIAPLLINRSPWISRHHYFILIFLSYPNFSPIDEIELRTESEERWKMRFSPRFSLLSTLILLLLIQLNWNLDMVCRLVI